MNEVRIRAFVTTTAEERFLFEEVLTVECALHKRAIKNIPFSSIPEILIP